jgi:hypothetical protein
VVKGQLSLYIILYIYVLRYGDAILNFKFLGSFPFNSITVLIKMTIGEIVAVDVKG